MVTSLIDDNWANCPYKGPLQVERWLSEEGLGNEQAEFEAELLAELMADDIDMNADSGYNAYDDAGGQGNGAKESAHVEL